MNDKSTWTPTCFKKNNKCFVVYCDLLQNPHETSMMQMLWAMTINQCGIGP